jgi:hypothetical protein
MLRDIDIQQSTNHLLILRLMILRFLLEEVDAGLAEADTLQLLVMSVSLVCVAARNLVDHLDSLSVQGAP